MWREVHELAALLRSGQYTWWVGGWSVVGWMGWVRYDGGLTGLG